MFSNSPRIEDSGYGAPALLSASSLHKLAEQCELDHPSADGVYIHAVLDIPRDHPDSSVDTRSGMATYTTVAELTYNEEGHRAIYGYHERAGFWSCFAD